MKFKSDIEVQAGLKDSSGSNGTSGQVLSSSVSGVAWTNVNTTATDVQNLVKAGVAINKGQAVYVTSADGTNIIVGLASNTSEATSSKTLGLLDATVAINGMANVVQIGRLAGLNTIGAAAGDPVWLGANGNLIYGLANKPYAPLHLVFIGIVTRVNSNNGEIFINVQNGFELNEIHDVDLKTNIPISGDVLGYDGTLWVNKTIAGWLGYTPADDANVVKLTGNQTINGEKTFAGTIYSDNATYLKQYTSFSNQTDYTNIGGQPDGIYIGTTSAASTISMTNLTAFRFYELPDASGTIALTSDIAGYVPYTGATSNVNLGSYSITANSFIKAGGNSTQYLKADGSVSTAMNSRVEANFVATSGQTTFTTPYEVGQVEVYYNGSKLYPDEFVATNGSTIVLVTPATLNAQISIVKFVSSFNTTSIRTESVFTTTSGQTTFSVNYAIGQVDVFYNGSKLSPAEFTATNGTSVVLGFACAAGESIVIDSFVNQVSGAVGTANKVAKFTGTASLGDSQIFDNGTYVGINNINPTEVLDVTGAINVSSAIRSSGEIMLRRSGNELRLGSGVGADYSVFYAGGSERMRITSGGNVGIGTLSPSRKLEVTNGSDSIIKITGSGGSNFWVGTENAYTSVYASDLSNAYNGEYRRSIGPSTGWGGFHTFYTDTSERMRITSGGNVLIGTTTDAGYKLDVNGTGRIQTNLMIGSGSSATSKLEVASGDIKLTDGYKLGWRYAPADSNYYNYIGNSYDGASEGSGINYRAGSWTGGDIIAHSFYTYWGSVWVERISIRNSGTVSFNHGSGFRTAIQGNNQINTTYNGGGTAMYLNFQGNGAIYAGSSYATLYAGSDRRIKTDIKDAESTLDKILNLTPRTFRYKERPNDVSYGFIAQEVEEIMPEIVKTSEGISNCAGEEIVDQKSIESYGLAWASILVKAIQEQQAQIKELQDELVLLKNK